MFVRRKTNKSGTISVHVVDKSRGGYRVVKVFGPAATSYEADLLENKARQFMAEKTGSMGSLFAEDGMVGAVIPTLKESQMQVAGPELIFGALYDRIGYGKLKDEMFRHMVICRLLEGGSKLRTMDYLREYLGQECAKARIYRALDALDVKAQIGKITAAYARQATPKRELRYLLTGLRYEAAAAEDMRLAGFKKEGRPRCPQIIIGMLIASDGTPLGYDTFEKVDAGALVARLGRIAAGYKVARPLVVADAGILSKECVRKLDGKGYRYIVGVRPRSQRAAVQQQILGFDMQGGDVRCIQAESRLVVTKNPALIAGDALAREEEIDRLRKKLSAGKVSKSSLNNRGSNRFLKKEGRKKISIDTEKVSAEAVWDGIRVFTTNTSLVMEAVGALCGSLWDIERDFAISKVDVRVRPLNNGLSARIGGHISICFAACAVRTLLERILHEAGGGLTLERVREIVRSMHRLNYVSQSTGRRRSVLLQMDSAQRQLYELVNPGK